MSKVLRGQVRLDDARFPNTDIYSVKASVELENGFVGALGDVEEGNRDIRALEASATGKSLVLIANPVVIYDNARLGSDHASNYFMEIGEAVRAYKPKATYVFSVTKEAISGAATVGQYLIAGDGYKLTTSATIPLDATGFVGKVIRKDTVGGALSINVNQSATEYIVIDTIQN